MRVWPAVSRRMLALFRLAVASVVAGEGLTKNAVEAERLIELRLRAADQGNTDAQYSLGVMYANGKGGVEDVAEAARLFRLAADQGHAEAQFSLGVMHEIGKRVEDSETAKVTAARANLTGMYEMGKGIPTDLAEAVRLYRLAADQGHAWANFILGNMYHNGMGVANDAVEAARLYRVAADQGLANAQFNLGLMYELGEGMSNDSAKAARLYRLAADQGLPHAQNGLGEMYAKGEGGVPKDFAKAARLFRLAADQGLAVAQDNLNLLRRMGIRVPNKAAKHEVPASMISTFQMLATGRVSWRQFCTALLTTVLFCILGFKLVEVVGRSARHPGRPAKQAAQQAVAKQPATAKEAAKQAAVERKEAERNEAERQAAAKKEAAKQVAATKKAERKETERKEAERKEAERKEAERKEAERKEAERQASASAPRGFV